MLFLPLDLLGKDEETRGHQVPRYCCFQPTNSKAYTLKSTDCNCLINPKVAFFVST